MQTLSARHRRVKDAAWKTAEPTLREFDAALRTARREIEAIEARTFAPPRPTNASDTILAGEIRRRLSELKEDERRAALETALAEGAEEVVAAALHGPAMLSGMSAPQQASLRDRWRRSRHGDEIDRIDRLKSAVADTERGGELLVRYAATLADPQIIEKAEASEAAAKAALAS